MANKASVPSRRRFLLLGAGRSAASPVDGPLKARIALECLALKGVVCRSCSEHCEPRAIRFQLLPAGRSLPGIDDEACDACGECVRACPVQAIALRAIEAALS